MPPAAQPPPGLAVPPAAAGAQGGTGDGDHGRAPGAVGELLVEVDRRAGPLPDRRAAAAPRVPDEALPGAGVPGAVRVGNVRAFVPADSDNSWCGCPAC